MSVRWMCPVPWCGEEITSIGPVSQAWDIEKHYKDLHSDIDALTNKLKTAVVPHTWTCQKQGCPSPDISRGDEEALDLAIVGHNRHYHYREAELVTAQHVQDKNAVFVRMHGGATPYDFKFLAGIRIIW